MPTTIQSDTEHWEKICMALANKQYDFRTVAGIARETGLEESRVEELLKIHSAEVRMAYSTNKKGDVLYTLSEKGQSLREIWSNVKSIVTSSTASST